MQPETEITGVILAGGRASRMGGQDKGLLDFSGQPLIEYVLQGLRPQLQHFVINANRNQQRYGEYGPVISDSIADYAGPLAGMLAAMESLSTRYILTVPCDSPFLPADLVARLWQALTTQQASIAVAHDGKRLQPVFALVDTQLKPRLQNYLAAGDRKIDLWFEQNNMVAVDFSDQPQAFININNAEELAQTAQALREGVSDGA